MAYAVMFSCRPVHVCLPVLLSTQMAVACTVVKLFIFLARHPYFFDVE